ncbi:MAG: hypothetical protein UHN47_06840 [Lachnospiraceae bacterium]|nr:hypothetical protein [Lachnospiraceae bacterium]
MKKRILVCFAVFTLTLASSITAFAAPEVMPDGGVFDVEYYAQNNPDVVAAFGTDKELLYSHYVNNGRAEGRLAVAPEAQNVTTQDAQAVEANEFMEEVYSKVINVSTTNPIEFYSYALANIENIKKACTFVEAKDCPSLCDGIPMYTVYYYTYVAKDGQRLNVIINVGDTHWATDTTPRTIIEFIIDPQIVDSTRPDISLITNQHKYEHYIKINDFNIGENYYINGDRYCEFNWGLRRFKEDAVFNKNWVLVKANEYVEWYGVVAGLRHRFTYTR